MPLFLNEKTKWSCEYVTLYARIRRLCLVCTAELLDTTPWFNIRTPHKPHTTAQCQQQYDNVQIVGVATSRLGFCTINLRCLIAPRFPAAAIVAAWPAAPPSLQTYVDLTTLTVGLLVFQGISSRRMHSAPNSHSTARGCC